MSQQTRTTALQEAVKVASISGGDADILSLAEVFHTFLTSDDAPAAAPAAPATPAPTPAKAKPAKGKPATKDPEPTPEPEADEADEDEETGPSGDDVKAVISKLLEDGQRDELVALLKKYKATSFSGVKVADYPKFIAEGKQITSNANLTK